MKKMRKAAGGGLAALIAATMLAACGDAPDESDDSGSKPPRDFLPCIVSDAGGFDDKSFNQLGYEGVKEAADELGVELQGASSPTARTTTPPTSTAWSPRAATPS